jgi:hypothetical protein
MLNRGVKSDPTWIFPISRPGTAHFVLFGQHIHSSQSLDNFWHGDCIEGQHREEQASADSRLPTGRFDLRSSGQRIERTQLETYKRPETMMKRAGTHLTSKIHHRPGMQLSESLLPIQPPIDIDGENRSRLELDPRLKSVIYTWLIDIWLLSSDETPSHSDEDLDLSCDRVWSHGRPLALVSDGRMQLLGSRRATLEALLDVGIEIA